MIVWLIFFFLAVILSGLIVLFFYLSQSKSVPSSALLIQQQIDSVRTDMSEEFSRLLTHMNEQLLRQTVQLNQQMGLMTQEMHSRLAMMGDQVQNAAGQMGVRMDHASLVAGEVQQNLGALTQVTEKVYEVGKDIASLQEILKAPKLRGILGELFLGELLCQILPPASFSLQYTFKTGDIVDAMIHLGHGGVPVDSKFPLENFRKYIEATLEDERKGYRKKFIQDVKRHIDQIAFKYILPDEGTFDFALMYIPAENVYYETIIKEENNGEERSLSAYSLEKKVIPVSPGSFYAYLQAILLGLKGLHIEESSREILEYLSRLKGDFSKFKEDFDILGRHLNNSKVKYEDSLRKLDRFNDKLEEIGEPLKKIDV